MQFEENEKLVSVHFDSILDLIEGDFPECANKKRLKDIMSNLKCDSNFYGKTNKTYRQVIDHALIGDSVLMENLEQKIKILRDVLGKNTREYDQKVKSQKRKRRFDNDGDELDIEKVYNGELDTCWSRTEKIEFDKDHKFVTLFIENGGLSNVGVESSFWRAAVSVFLTEELEKAGKTVRIIVGSCSRQSIVGSWRMMTQSMTVKEYNQRVSLERIAAMTHIGFFRCVGFAMRLACKHVIDYSFGYTEKISSNTYPLQLQKQISKGNMRLIHINSATSQWQAIDAIEYAYKQFLNIDL